jgi:aspartate 1-decarboxylase
MLIKMLRGKIHRATVTDKHVGYNGSITVDPLLLEKAGLKVGEAVLVSDINNGTRHETYIQRGEPGKGQIVLNGAAARLGEVGDLVIIMGFAYCTPEEADTLESKVVLVDELNRFKSYLPRA